MDHHFNDHHTNNQNLLENPFHICKDYRLQITEDVSKMYPFLRLDSGMKSINKSNKQKETDTTDLIDREVRSLLNHFQSEQVTISFFVVTFF